MNTELIDSYRYILLKQIHSVDIGAEMMLFIGTQFSNLEPLHLSASSKPRPGEKKKRLFRGPSTNDMKK